MSHRTIVITGATSGIGAAAARKFAELGDDLVLIGRNMERGIQLETELRSLGVDVVFQRCDVSDKSQVEKMARTVEEHFEKVDVLFNNAGVMLPSMEIERMPAEEWEKTFDININGMFYVTRALKPFIQKVHGCIINNASIAGMQHYAAGRSYAFPTKWPKTMGRRVSVSTVSVLESLIHRF